MDQRHTREERLTRQKDIDDCYRKGRRLSGKLLRVHVRPNELEYSRLAISIPGRIVRKSVERSRWKRLIREAFRLNKERIVAGMDIVAVPSRVPGDLRRQDVEAALIALLARRR